MSKIMVLIQKSVKRFMMKAIKTDGILALIEIDRSVAKMAENKMEQYCKLPIPIKAYQTDKEIDIETLEGTHHASVGDWIITGVNGEQYPCKPDIFEKTYIKCGQANKMKQVAAMFGKKLGEEFTVKVPQYDEYGEVVQYQNVKGYFCGRGFRSEQINFADAFIFAELLEGYAVIVDD